MSNVPAPQLTPTGFIAPTQDEIMAGLWADWQAAFDNALSTNLETPQGQVVTSQTAILNDSFALFLSLMNNVDPAFASGRMQDALCRLNFLTRKEATATQVVATCTGLNGLVIPAGSLAKATDGRIYASVAAGTISSGAADIIFECVDKGPITCAAGTLNSIYQVVSGWDSIANAADGTPGRNDESRRDFEARRQASVAANAVGTNGAMKGAVLNVAGVTDVYVIDNPSASSVTKQGVTLPAYCVYAAVKGGTDADVAKALWSKKAPGAPWYASANTTVTVTDTDGYVTPYPTYSIKFQRPSNLPVYFAVSIANSAAVPANAAQIIKDAIIATFTGDNVEKPTIGSTVYASKFYAAIAGLGSWAQIISCLVGPSAVAATANSIASDLDEIPSIAAAQIAVTFV